MPTYINYLPSVRLKYLLDGCATDTGIPYIFDVVDATELATKQARLDRLMVKLMGKKCSKQFKR